MRALDRQTLKGLWAAIPTPWTSDGRLEAAMLARNCERLASAKVDGVYTTDSDGEFYAIELDEFRTLARAFARAMEPTGVDAAMGVTWTNTKGVIDRLRIACDAGIPNVHVAFPYFMPLAPGDVDRFFEDLASAVPEGRWIHYAHPRAEPALTGKDYARLSETFPAQLIGTKIAPLDLTVLTEILLRSPMIAHLVVDTNLLPAMLLGARGCNSYWVNTMPRWHRCYMDACVEQRWNDARAFHLKLIEWELTHTAPLRQAGYRHGILGKARSALTGFLEDTGITRPPYQPVTAKHQAEYRRAFDQFWGAELAEEDLLRSV